MAPGGMCLLPPLPPSPSCSNLSRFTGLLSPKHVQLHLHSQITRVRAPALWGSSKASSSETGMASPAPTSIPGAVRGSQNPQFLDPSPCFLCRIASGSGVSVMYDLLEVPFSFWNWPLHSATHSSLSSLLVQALGRQGVACGICPGETGSWMWHLSTGVL